MYDGVLSLFYDAHTERNKPYPTQTSTSHVGDMFLLSTVGCKPTLSLLNITYPLL